ncbi:hypothetical protein [Komagataeibacter oboediens]|uniref:Uncharacterized protein n=1 Tax=Komagataeibacter oboediens TaxID=65958 RepID=A0ABS5SRU0_9PROT|nr:hypothetical protein [Komagataeibacter oboediens]MBT0676849.1 hypothetical protein [Komagataeibacter oboediens]MBT0680167.1 hypothetical protein [Komagataeibacter oboediens]
MTSGSPDPARLVAGSTFACHPEGPARRTGGTEFDGSPVRLRGRSMDEKPMASPSAKGPGRQAANEGSSGPL